MDAKILRAIKVAADNHEGQRYGDVAYITHPLTVGMILLDAGADADTVAVGILHDTMEDTDLTYESIEADFGEVVARTVLELTRGDETYPEYVDGIGSTRAKAVKAIDSLVNLLDLDQIGDVERQERLRSRYTANIRRFSQAITDHGLVLSEKLSILVLIFAAAATDEALL